MIKQLAAECTNHSFHIGILPRRCGCSNDLFYPKAFNPSGDLFAENTIAVPNQIARRCIKWKPLHELLSSPLCRRMFGHIEVSDSASIMRQNNQHKQHAKRHCRDHEKIDRRQFPGMLVEKRLPCR